LESKRRAIVMLGLPASGKGTQAENIAQKIEAETVGIGDLVRDAMANGDLADKVIKKIKSNYSQGIPQNDDVVGKLLEEKVKNTTRNLIFDNYPFSLKQIYFFERLIREYNFSEPEIIYIKIKPESSIKRITTRLVCDKCKKIYLSGNVGDNCKVKNCGGKLTQRADDTLEIMRKRVNFAQPRINLVVDYYRDKARVHEIDGEKTISEVSNDINRILCFKF
jgi:adenylate kinase